MFTNLQSKLSWFVLIFTIAVFGIFILDRRGIFTFERPYKPVPGEIIPSPPPPLPLPGPLPGPAPTPPGPVVPEAEGLQVWVPKEMRIYNKSGS